MVLVVEDIGRIVGVLRGGRADYPRRTLLESLFIDGKFHHQGIGRQLVTYFEQDYITRDVKVFKLSAPSSQCHSTKAWALKKSTGMRSICSFDQAGLPYQPMNKIVKDRRPG